MKKSFDNNLDIALHTLIEAINESSNPNLIMKLEWMYSRLAYTRKQRFINSIKQFVK